MDDPTKKIRELIEGQDLVSVEPDTSIHDVVAVMAEHDIGAVPVVGAGKLVGIFSERDLVRRVVAKDVPLSEPVESVMTRDVVSIAPDDVIEDAIVTMKIKGFRHMPVVGGDDEELLGMLSFRDLLQADLDLIRERASLLNRLVRSDPIYDS